MLQVAAELGPLERSFSRSRVELELPNNQSFGADLRRLCGRMLLTENACKRRTQDQYHESTRVVSDLEAAYVECSLRDWPCSQSPFFRRHREVL
jgi:hypothetical protein